MKTVLESCRTLFLDSILYKDSLQIIVTEGFVLDETESMQVGDYTFDNIQPIERTEKSRQFKIEFDYDNLINFQLVKESFTTFDKNEIRDTDGFLQVISNSEYMKYVNANHGWFEDIYTKGVKHYRVWTEDEVIDIVSAKEPIIQEVIKT